MKKTTTQNTSKKKPTFKPTPVADIPGGFGDVLSGRKSGTQAASDQVCADLGQFFGSIPGIREIFSKGPLNSHQQQETEQPYCEDCEAETACMLNKCRSAAFRVEVLSVLAADLLQNDMTDNDRITAVLSEIEHQSRGIQLIAGPAL